MLSENIVNDIKKGNTRTFYTSAAWINKRKYIINRDNNECQRCKKLGKVHIAECVHHIKHLKDRPDLALEDKNLVSVCNVCHNILHPEKLNNPKPKFINEEKW
ncbi:HNH endonuclease [Clostridium tetani]|uniref:HNH endonuclease n=1 Tax=Clostridium tetani TaxID=1513 RepID=UPI001027006A|nr:HNH endonuclease [Clostridium tetani]RXI70512.1 HNH endonuclease [Clostridium tetani]